MGAQAVSIDRNGGTSWMSRRREVLAHLRVVADEVTFVKVAAGGDSDDATLSIVPGEPPELMLHLGGSTHLPAAVEGAVVKVNYAQGRSSYEFLAQVTKREEYGRVHVSLPRVVEQRERRMARRLNVYGRRKVRVHTDWGGELTVFDLSSTGLGLVGTSSDVRRVLRDGIRGVLMLTADLRMNVWLEVRHHRDLDSSGKILIGCRFLGLSSRDTTHLLNFLDARFDEG